MSPGQHQTQGRGCGFAQRRRSQCGHGVPVWGGHGHDPPSSESHMRSRRHKHVRKENLVQQSPTFGIWNSNNLPFTFSKEKKNAQRIVFKHSLRCRRLLRQQRGLELQFLFIILLCSLYFSYSTEKERGNFRKFITQLYRNGMSFGRQKSRERRTFMANLHCQCFFLSLYKSLQKTPTELRLIGIKKKKSYSGLS